MTAKLFAALPALAFAVAVAAQPVITPSIDFSTARVAAGSWSYQAVPGGSNARFIDTSGTARLALECSKVTRRVSISRTSATAAPSLSVWTSDASRTIAARFEPNAMRVVAELGAHDPLLDAMAYSRGRIAVTLLGVGVGAGTEPLIVPAWPEVARTIEDCRI